MNEVELRAVRNLPAIETTDLLMSAYKASDALEEVMTADIPVLSPVYGGSYERRMQNARRQYSEAVARLSTNPELQERSDAIHTARCGCSAEEQREDCDWYVAGKVSAAKSRRILQAGELSVNGFTVADIADYPEIFKKWIDYLEASREERPALQLEFQQLVAQVTR
ncbi:MAG TPA: hypothetical protein VFW90_03720 [Candidatus Saccharimonadales bacterium]|nr:hypothetical protein [Candidatus Saccharimonadales bacterium]